MAHSDSDDDIPLARLNSEDNIPLARLKSHIIDEPMNEPHSERSVPDIETIKTIKLSFVPEQATIPDGTGMISEDESDEMSIYDYDSDRDPEYNPGACEVRRCKEEVWAACPECEILLCFDHFNEDILSCLYHGKNTRKMTKNAMSVTNKIANKSSETASGMNENASTIEPIRAKKSIDKHVSDMIEKTLPEHYTVEGSEKEVRHEKEARSNKQKEAKRKRSLGQDYTSMKTKKVVPARQMKARCKGDTCTKQKKQCTRITDDQRKAIFDSYHALGDLRLQREFLVRHVKVFEAKRKYTQNESRRAYTRQYLLTVGEKSIPVCKVLFFNTLGISEQSARTALDKLTSTGTVDKDNRGGRQSETERERDAFVRKEISAHIDRFPRVESHFCREKSTKEYLCPDLTKRRMFHMFLQEWIPRVRPPCITTYIAVFKSKNLSIFRPKKDQCSLCANYFKGNEEIKRNLQDKFEKHVGEKQKVREIKELSKKEAMDNENILCASFDLQQVIYLPISQESAIFYKRRLSNYNLTFYNIANRNCHCFTWDETQSKRGASEISTAVYQALQLYDSLGIKKAYLFADGCSGQNKNSISPAMMLYAVIKSVNLEEISLRFFETNHGQNEGDSAHSAIGHALKRAGDVFLPSQVATVMSLARPQKPYLVKQLQYEDFLNFKGLSKELRILDARRGSGSDDIFAWNSVMELRVLKAQPDTVFYKTSHFDSAFKELSLKRLTKSVKDHTLQKLNAGATTISKEKYNDLVSLCSGPTPVIKLAEHKAFYLSLPHD